MSVRLSTDATEVAVRAALQHVNDRLIDAGCGDGLRCSAQIVLGEALNNVVEHAYGPDGDGEIRLALSLGPGGLHCEVHDNGRAMPFGPLPGSRFPDIDPNDIIGLPEGGFGWAMMRRLTSELHYARNGAVNHLRFFIPVDDEAAAKSDKSR